MGVFDRSGRRDATEPRAASNLWRLVPEAKVRGRWRERPLCAQSLLGGEQLTESGQGSNL